MPLSDPQQDVKTHTLSPPTTQPHPPPMHPNINALGFQAAWWACILGAAWDREITALVFCAVLAELHLLNSKTTQADIQLGLISVLIGLVLDSLLQYFSIVSFKGWTCSPLSPYWMWMVWWMFALTLNSSLAFLKRYHWALAALAGGVLGPLSYLAGARLGAADMTSSPANLTILAASWALVLPALVALAKRSAR